MERPRIETIDEKKLIGMRIRTSLAENATVPLWKRFMPRVKEIGQRLNGDYFSVQHYDLTTFAAFSPHTMFEKWAAVEVENSDAAPAEMESLIIPPGKYAVFIHKGPASAFGATSNFIFRQWLPSSGYHLDDRPHFEVMGSKYSGHENPASEEEVWVPIRS